jgi:phage shock protein C
MCLGVCAGFADYFGFDPSLTRIITAIAAFIFFPLVIVVYFLLGLLLEKEPLASRKHTRDDDVLRRRVRGEPHATLSSIRHRFRELDRRMQKLEQHVTSKRFRLDQEFDGLRD